MGCGCNKRNRQQWEVVVGGRIVYTSTNKSTAETVARRYDGSEVREKSQQQAGAGS
ncbi:hypothetical protein ACFOWE_18185 [Planomonospora corallina]|uniref:DUF1508 domain-containing protein n=1 Tax=Planomonospora corallina TaxID=1806052 RepID=A0ABV8IB64_9ACTN